jgi:hypothetical protein
MNICTLCEKETPTPEYPVYVANVSHSTNRSGAATTTRTSYTDILPATFTVCKDCLEKQKQIKTQRKMRNATILLGIGVAALILGLFGRNAISDAVCLPSLVVVALTFGVGLGILSVVRRIRATLDRAAGGGRLSDEDLVYVFHDDLTKLAAKMERTGFLTEARYRAYSTQ